jgi:hypothetical protein
MPNITHVFTLTTICDVSLPNYKLELHLLAVPTEPTRTTTHTTFHPHTI